MKPTATIRQVPPIWDFRRYHQGDWTPGRSKLLRCLWMLVSSVVFESNLFPFYSLKRLILIGFGASVGQRVTIKPRVQIKFPWRLTIQDDVWIGERVWIDNLERVTIGTQCCLSQGVYLCTGSHDYRHDDFRLSCLPIQLEHHVWLCAGVTILPGTRIPAGSVVSAGQVVSPHDVGRAEKVPEVSAIPEPKSHSDSYANPATGTGLPPS